MNMSEVVNRSRLVHDEATVRTAIDQLALRLDLALRFHNPLLICVLQGGVYLAGQLLARLRFPLQQATVQVTRYGDSTTPGELRWLSPLSMEVRDRSVLLVDDVFDRGLTLSLLHDHLLTAGARQIVSAVIVRKDVEHQTTYRPDYIALECGADYLFGCGMDYHGYWRNLPEIRALPDDLMDDLKDAQ